MDSGLTSANENIRKIEDIIDIQKANGNLNGRQVAFNLPAAAATRPRRGLGAHSHDSGLAARLARRRVRRRQHGGGGGGVGSAAAGGGKRARSPAADAVSWPSDSDITVLRMKLCAGGGGRGRSARAAAPLGDGLHRPDGYSMVNLATLVLHTQSASKHSLPTEEYLLPLSSWEAPRRPPAAAASAPAVAATPPPHATKTSKLAKFLRLYFCPCCTCLYEIEKMREEQSFYTTKSKSPIGANQKFPK